jgi:hypothetical protein
VIAEPDVGPAFSGGSLNVLDFGADPSGLFDSSPAFQAAIAAYSPAGKSTAPVIDVPVGTYRFASEVRIKKSVWIRGSQGQSPYPSCLIKPDHGITAFVFERHNTPLGTTDSGAGDGAQLTNLIIQPVAKAADWRRSHAYRVGDKVRSGTGKREDWRRHYVCTAAGTSASSGIGPRSFDDELDGSVRWRYIGPGAGIKIRANGCTLRDITVKGCSGAGIHIEAQDPEVPSALANANGWHLQNVAVWSCDGHGLYVNGSDTNGGSYIHGVLYGNGSPASDEDFTGTGYNIYDSSFLGNTYVAIQLGSGGLGSLFCDSVGGGSTFVGCYQEGTGGGHNVVDSSTVILGGGLSLGEVVSSAGANSPCVRIGPVGTGGQLGQTVAGYSGPPWRPNVAVILGNRRANNGNLYQVITAGVTAASGGPSGTGADIADGTAHWAFVHALTDSGRIQLGSANPDYKVFFFAQAPDDIGVGDATYYRYDNFGGAKDVQGFQYGISGPNPAVTEGNGTGMMHATNKTIVTEWPMKIPAGKALVDQLWVGGCRVAFGTGAPTAGTWNKGDRIYYKGSAVRAGGAEGLICVSEGTASSYTGSRTATADGSAILRISGAAMSTLKDQQDFKVGDVLTINAVTSRVQAVSADGLTVTMGQAIPAGSGLTIASHPPVFKQFGSIEA